MSNQTGSGGGKAVGAENHVSLQGLNWRFLRENLEEEQRIAAQQHAAKQKKRRNKESKALDDDESDPSWESLDNFLGADDARRRMLLGVEQGIGSDNGDEPADASATTHARSPSSAAGAGAGAAAGAQPATGSSELENLFSAARQRSGSPIIIWRSSAKVSLADNVPRELVVATGDYGRGNMFAGRPHTQSHVEATAHSSYRPTRGSTSSKKSRRRGNKSQPASGLVFSSSSSAPTSPSQSGSFSYRPARNRKQKRQYGAWYIPPKQWAACYKNGKPGRNGPAVPAGKKTGNRSAQRSRKRGTSGEDSFGASGTSDAEVMAARAAAYRKEIPGLPISRMLADFIRESGGKSGHARLPHFLKDMGGDSSAHLHSLSSSHHRHGR